jgi:hypothetical protein
VKLRQTFLNYDNANTDKEKETLSREIGYRLLNLSKSSHKPSYLSEVGGRGSESSEGEESKGGKSTVDMANFNKKADIVKEYYREHNASFIEGHEHLMDFTKMSHYTFDSFI